MSDSGEEELESPSRWPQDVSHYRGFEYVNESSGLFQLRKCHFGHIW